MAIPYSEWLDEAKRLPVGQTRRIYHGAERRPNLVIRNMDDRYTAYCHSCHEGSVHMKAMVKHQHRVVAEDFQDFYVWNPPNEADYKRAAIFLASKDMAMLYLERLVWSVFNDRLVFHTPQMVLGRDMSGHSKAKWLVYSYTKSFNTLRPVPSFGFDQQTVILCEDLFSAAKWDYFTPANTWGVHLNGTDIQSDLTSLLLTARHVVLALDGDSAGREGEARITRALQLVGIVPTIVRVPEGKDPKNMDKGYFQSTWDTLISTK